MERTLDHSKIEAEIVNLMIETARINAEARNFGQETSRYSIIGLATGVGTLVAVLVNAVKIFH